MKGQFYARSLTGLTFISSLFLFGLSSSLFAQLVEFRAVVGFENNDIRLIYRDLIDVWFITTSAGGDTTYDVVFMDEHFQGEQARYEAYETTFVPNAAAVLWKV